MNFSLLIVVPTLNSYGILPRLIISLQSQSWLHWRLLFVDGPSDQNHRLWLESCCAQEPRCRWLEQDHSMTGIFAAMNIGFANASPDEWVLFWGSDDWASGPNVLSEVVAAIESASQSPDLLVCRGRYVSADSGALLRASVFHPARLLTGTDYRRALFFGLTPPHQATVISPAARRRLSSYATAFRLSADLDYFLKLSCQPGLLIQCLDLELVQMSDAGVSGQQTSRRLHEVQCAYRSSFGWFWWFPFLARYTRRLFSLVPAL